MLSLATILCLDSQETDYSTGLKVTFGITMLITCLIGLMPTTTTDTKGVSSTTYGIEKYHGSAPCRAKAREGRGARRGDGAAAEDGPGE